MMCIGASALAAGSADGRLRAWAGMVDAGMHLSSV
jgi:hypothetical protein